MCFASEHPLRCLGGWCKTRLESRMVVTLNSHFIVIGGLGAAANGPELNSHPAAEESSTALQTLLQQLDIEKDVLRILQRQRIRTVGMLADMARVDLFQIGILMGDASTIISAAKKVLQKLN
jgi:hypothetical protein